MESPAQCFLERMYTKKMSVFFAQVYLRFATATVVGKKNNTNIAPNGGVIIGDLLWDRIRKTKITN